MNTFIIPFQLSPVETWKSVRKAMPKFSKVACRLIPSHGFSSLQTERGEVVSLSTHGTPSCHPNHPLRVPPTTLSSACGRTVPSPQMGQLRLKEVIHWLGSQSQKHLGLLSNKHLLREMGGVRASPLGESLISQTDLTCRAGLNMGCVALSFALVSVSRVALA